MDSNQEGLQDFSKRVEIALQQGFSEVLSEEEEKETEAIMSG